MKTLSLVLAAALTLVLGCSGESDEPSDTAQEAATMSSAEKVTADQEAAETGTVTLVGKSGCGHCTFHRGESCAAALQTADGNIYLLDNIDPDSELFKKRMDGVPVTVTGTVVVRGGDKHVTVESHELM